MSTTTPTTEPQADRPKWADKFLEALSECGNVTDAAKAARVGRATVYDWRTRDTEFRSDMDKARDAGIEGLEDEARRRAFHGTEEPVYQGGSMVGTVRKYSDVLLIFLLKGARPEKYRDRAQLQHVGPGGGPLQSEVRHVSPAEAVAATAKALEMAGLVERRPPA